MSHWSIKRSGTEEEYNVIHQLIDDAASYFADMQKEYGVKKNKKKAKKMKINKKDLR